MDFVIFTAPKPFIDPHIKTIQDNAIKSWKALGAPRIILFGSEPGIAEAASRFGVDHVPKIEYSKAGAPLASDVFSQAERLSSNAKALVYTNADMIYSSDLASAIEQVVEALPRFLVLARRWDLDIQEELFFPESIDRLNEKLRTSGRLHSPSGMDCMIFAPGQWSTMKPYCIGRAGWDGALLAETLYNGIPVVDATDCITAIHQDHSYDHVPGGVNEIWNGEDAWTNRELATPLTWIVDIFYATWLLTQTGLIKKKLAPALPARPQNARQVVVESPIPPAPPRVAIPPVHRPETGALAPHRHFDAPQPFRGSKRVQELVVAMWPKPFKGHTAAIQHNALESWWTIKPIPALILVGDEHGVDKVAPLYGAERFQGEYSKDGALLASSIFAFLSEQNAHVVCFVNADIIVTQSLARAAALAVAKLPKFLMIGRRWCLDIRKRLRFRSRWQIDLQRQVHAGGRLDAPDALDWFAFTPGTLEDLPDLRIGRAAWEGALIDYALEAGIPVIDATEVFVVHQEHDYDHVAGGKQEVWYGKDAQHNRKLRPNWARTVADATWKLTTGGLYEK